MSDTGNFATVTTTLDTVTICLWIYLSLRPEHIVLHYVAHLVIIFLAILLPQLLEQVEMTDRSRRTHLRLTCLKSGSNFNSVSSLGKYCIMRKTPLATNILIDLKFKIVVGM